MRIFGKEIKLFGRQNTEKGFEIDSRGNVTYRTEAKSVKRLRPFGALVFVGVVKEKFIFEPAEIVIPKWHIGVFDGRKIDPETFEIKEEIQTIERTDINEPLDSNGISEDNEVKEEKLVIENPYNLPVACLPCYLTDTSAVNDLAHFTGYYHHSYMLVTIHTHVKYLKKWGTLLEGEIKTSKIADILSSYKTKPIVANKMLSALKMYAKYREAYGDPLLKMMLATSDRIKRLEVISSRKIVTEEKMVSTYLLARVAAMSGDKVGIWLGLILFGFRRTEFDRVMLDMTINHKYIYYINRRIMKKRVHESVYRTEVPDWLHYAYTETDKRKLNRSETEVFVEVTKYGTNPSMLFNACSYYDFDWHKYELRLRSGDVAPVRDREERNTDTGDGKPERRSKVSKRT